MKFQKHVTHDDHDHHKSVWNIWSLPEKFRVAPTRPLTQNDATYEVLWHRWHRESFRRTHWDLLVFLVYTYLTSWTCGWVKTPPKSTGWWVFSSSRSQLVDRYSPLHADIFGAIPNFSLTSCALILEGIARTFYHSMNLWLYLIGLIVSIQLIGLAKYV